MATKKQKRRREKERRHEYEYVYVDEEGQEVEVDEREEERKNGKSPAQRAVKTDRGRTVDPPSWRRTLRRAAIFSPLMFVILYLLKPKGSTRHRSCSASRCSWSSSSPSATSWTR